MERPSVARCVAGNRYWSTTTDHHQFQEASFAGQNIAQSRSDGCSPATEKMYFVVLRADAAKIAIVDLPDCACDINGKRNPRAKDKNPETFYVTFEVAPQALCAA